MEGIRRCNDIRCVDQIVINLCCKEDSCSQSYKHRSFGVC